MFTRTELMILEAIIEEARTYEPPTTERVARVTSVHQPARNLAWLERKRFIVRLTCGRWMPLRGPDGDRVDIPMTVRNELMRGPATLPTMPPLVRVGGRLKVSGSMRVSSPDARRIRPSGRVGGHSG